MKFNKIIYSLYYNERYSLWKQFFVNGELHKLVWCIGNASCYVATTMIGGLYSSNEEGDLCVQISQCKNKDHVDIIREYTTIR